MSTNPMMTKERAKYIQANRLPMGGLRMAFRKPCDCSTSLIYEDGITEAEDRYIRMCWGWMPGWTNYSDALWRITTDGN